MTQSTDAAVITTLVRDPEEREELRRLRLTPEQRAAEDRTDTVHERPPRRPTPIPAGLVADRLDIVAGELELRARFFRARAARWRTEVPPDVQPAAPTQDPPCRVPAARRGATVSAVEVHQDDAVQCQFQLAGLSEWIDAGNSHRDPEAILWGRIAKIAEEHGETIAALIGWTGQNPRKGVTHTVDDVVAELLDVAITALGAVEHLTGNSGLALPALCRKVDAVHTRATAAVELSR